MSFLENAKIRTKILSLILPICAVGIAASLILSDRFQKADIAYSNFITKEASAAVDMARANRNLAAVAYGAYQTLAYSQGTPELERASRVLQGERIPTSRSIC